MNVIFYSTRYSGVSKRQGAVSYDVKGETQREREAGRETTRCRDEALLRTSPGGSCSAPLGRLVVGVINGRDVRITDKSVPRVAGREKAAAGRHGAGKDI